MFEFLQYMDNVFTPFNFLILVLGTAGGLIFGALPGLSPTMAVALLIPFTFHMEPASGLILLGAMYTATVAGGAVSAILLKIPGAPANIATTLDGHAMARQGNAALALQLSFLSSGVGGVLGVFVLIFFTPVLAEWALSFGPSHLFWMAVLGVTIIASLASGSVVKGLTAGGIGLWISSIGYDGVHGVDRFTYSSHLFTKALVGLFASGYQHKNYKSIRCCGAFGQVADYRAESPVPAGLPAWLHTTNRANQDNYGKGEPEFALNPAVPKTSIRKLNGVIETLSMYCKNSNIHITSQARFLIDLCGIASSHRGDETRRSPSATLR